MEQHKLTVVIITKPTKKNNQTGIQMASLMPITVTMNETDGIHQAGNQNRANVVIVGDSMLKYVNPAKLRKSTKYNINVKTFPGAKVEDMKYYVKPALDKASDQLILHVGTNDIKHTSPQEIANSISSLGQEIEKQQPKTNLIISELIIRNDDPKLNMKIKELNDKLTQVCKNNKWDLINHKNILPNHLNEYGLHLTRQRTACLAKNFKNLTAIRHKSITRYF